jgi:hypothetical protein
MHYKRLNIYIVQFNIYRATGIPSLPEDFPKKCPFFKVCKKMDFFVIVKYFLAILIVISNYSALP